MQSLQNNFLNKFPELYSSSNEWALIEYKLQLSMGSTTAVVKKIWNVASPHMSSNFDKKNKGALILDSFKETLTLDENNRLYKVCQKNFEFSPQGLRFSAGYTQITPTAGRTYMFLLSKIAVGKSFCVPLKTVEKEKVRLPYGFDSIYVYNEDQRPDIFRHEYILYEQVQVLPCYVVQFEFDLQRYLSLKPPLCDVCQDNIAKIYCIVEDANFCPECNLDHHKTKLASKHSRVDISEKPKGFGYCPQHNDIKQELFCLVCNQPLCVNCKISGDHMTGYMANHMIVRITDAYSQCVDKSRYIDPNLEKRKNLLAESLGNIDVKIKEINKNASAIEEQIYQLLQGALRELQEHTQKKMSYLIGDQLELKRQYDQIQWVESFLQYEHEILMPSDFLAAWARHLKLRKEILNLANIPIITDVKADLKVEGRVKVITEGMARMPGSGEQQMMMVGGGGMEANSPEKQGASNEDIMIGSTPFRRNIFNKHHADKNAMIIKSGMTSNIKNVVPYSQGGRGTGGGGDLNLGINK